MRKFIIILTLVLSTVMSHAQDWISITLNERVAVKFPATPEVQEFANVNLYHVGDSAYMINVAASLIKLPAGITRDSLMNLYRHVTMSTVQAAWNGNVIRERKIRLGKYEGLEVLYSRVLPESNDVLVTARVILIDGLLYNFDFIDLRKEKQESVMKRFFGSIQLK